MAESGRPAEEVLITDLLRTLGVKQYDQRFVDCLMDLTYRATSDILKDAAAINEAAGGSGATLTLQDVALAAAQHARQQPQPPPLQELHALARRANVQPLTGPSDKQHGIKLPPVADCLLSTNYQLKPRPRPPAAAAAAGYQQPPRQHYAVKQHEGKQKLGLAIPQQWQPAADVAGAAAEPFPPPKHQQQAAAAAVGGGAAAGLQPPTAMDVDQEEI